MQLPLFGQVFLFLLVVFLTLCFRLFGILCHFFLFGYFLHFLFLQKQCTYIASAYIHTQQQHESHLRWYECINSNIIALSSLFFPLHSHFFFSFLFCTGLSLIGLLALCEAAQWTSKHPTHLHIHTCISSFKSCSYDFLFKWCFYFYI